MAFSLRANCDKPSFNRPIHDCDEGTTPQAKTPIWTATKQPYSTSTCGRQKGAGRWKRKKRSKRKSSCLFSACTSSARGARALSWTVPVEPNTKSQNTHSGCHKAALLSRHVQPSGTHPALSVPARNGASAKALPLLSVHLCPWGKSLKLDRSHWSHNKSHNTHSGSGHRITNLRGGRCRAFLSDRGCGGWATVRNHILRNQSFPKCISILSTSETVTSGT
jgi:hypothetical protein